MVPRWNTKPIFLLLIIPSPSVIIMISTLVLIPMSVVVSVLIPLPIFLFVLITTLTLRLITRYLPIKVLLFFFIIRLLMSISFTLINNVYLFCLIDINLLVRNLISVLNYATSCAIVSSNAPYSLEALIV